MVDAALQIQRLNVWKRINVPNDFQKKKDATVFDENGFVYYKRRLWVTLLKLTFLSQIIMLSHTTKNFCSDTMHTLMLKFVVNPCLSSIFLSMLAKELIDAEWL
jgi:hypothetical protein